MYYTFDIIRITFFFLNNLPDNNLPATIGFPAWGGFLFGGTWVFTCQVFEHFLGPVQAWKDHIVGGIGGKAGKMGALKFLWFLSPCSCDKLIIIFHYNREPIIMDKKNETENPIIIQTIQELESLYRDFYAQIQEIYRLNPEILTISFIEEKYEVFKSKRDTLIQQSLLENIKNKVKTA
jgi:hypothetical protein